MTSNSFASTAFQMCLSTEAILFGVFGFLYSVYGMYSNPSSHYNLQRPPIVARIKRVCQYITVLITFNALLSIVALFSLYNTKVLSISSNLPDLLDMILSGGFTLTMVAIAIISII